MNTRQKIRLHDFFRIVITQIFVTRDCDIWNQLKTEHINKSCFAKCFKNISTACQRNHSCALWLRLFTPIGFIRTILMRQDFCLIASIHSNTSIRPILMRQDCAWLLLFTQCIDSAYLMRQDLCLIASIHPNSSIRPISMRQDCAWFFACDANSDDIQHIQSEKIWMFRSLYPRKTADF